MYIIIFLTAVLLLAIILLAVFPVKVEFAYSSDNFDKPCAVISWLAPLFNGTITRENKRNIFTAHLFNKKIFTKELKVQKISAKKALHIIKNVKAHSIKLQASYSFSTPSITGMLFGIVNMISEYLYVTDLVNNPDFISDSDYFCIYGSMEIHVIASLISLRRINKKPFYPQALYSNK